MNMECTHEPPMDVASINTCLNGIQAIPTSVPLENNSQSLVSPETSGKEVFTQKGSLVQSDIPVLFQLFKDVYEQRIKAIESDKQLDKSEKNAEKLIILQQYVQQIEEQNDIFIATLLELESEAQKRVKQMEKRLKSSAKTTMEAAINIHECEKEMRRIVEERMYIESLYTDLQQHVKNIKEETGLLRDQNFNLNHDVQALLQVIHQARSTGHWEIDCVTFCEVTPEEVFGPVQSISNLYVSESNQVDLLQEPDKKVSSNSSNSSQEQINSSTSSLYERNKLQDKDSSTFFCEDFNHNEFIEKDRRIACLESKISELKLQLSMKESECECHLWKLELLMQQTKENGTESSCNCSDNDLADFNENELQYKQQVSTAMQTQVIPMYSVGLQAAIKRDDESSCICCCSDPGVNSFDVGKAKAILKKDFSLQLNGLNADTIKTMDEINDNSCLEMSVHQMMVAIQTLKENLMKAEDKAEAKEMLLSQLRSHITSAVKEVELKDTALENLEKKIDLSRNECTALMQQLEDLNVELNHVMKDLDEVQMLNDNLQLKIAAKEERVEHLLTEQKLLQEQKRALMTQLDSQGDELEKTRKEVFYRRNKETSDALQIEQQSSIIRNLQETLVQSKRAFDAAYQKAPSLQTVSSINESEPKSPKSSIVDI